MKKINLLVVALLFVMTAKANSNPVVYEACEAKKSLSTCHEDSENYQEMVACGSTYENTYENLSKKYNYKEEGNYELSDTEFVFSYSITSKPPASSDFSYSFPIQVDPSCNKIDPLLESVIDEVSIGTKFKFIMVKIFGGRLNKNKKVIQILEQNPNIFSYIKMCAVSIINQKSKFQGCSQ